MTADRLSNTFYRYFPVAKRDHDWGLYVTTVGVSRFGPGASYPPSGHPKEYSSVTVGRSLSEYQVVYISSGGGWLKVNGVLEQQIEAGHVMLLFPGLYHSYAPSATTGWKEYWVGFDGNFIRRLMRRGFFKRSQSVLHVDDEERLLALFNDIVKTTHDHRPASQQILAAITMNILALLYSGLNSSHEVDEPGTKAIQEAVARMRGSAETLLNIQELARELGISYRSFRRAFTRHTGLSPQKYLLEIRLARARTLLAQSSLSIKEIALRTGFEDVTYFCRFFHEKIGVVPTAFRCSHRKFRSFTGKVTPSVQPRED